jgi:hypothetical protein
MAQLVGVYEGLNTPAVRFRRALGRAFGGYSCDLSHITHSAFGISTAWNDMVARLEAEGHTHECVYGGDATPVVASASAGREPCVLILDEQGNPSMIADWNDLALAAGDVTTYERILRSKLLMY